MPSPSGFTVVDRRERTDAMNSDVSGMSFGASVRMDTPAGGGPACCGACDWPFDPPHAEADSNTANIAA